MTEETPVTLPTYFVRQLDDYSCGPAVLATVARLFDVDKDYLFFRDLMDPCQHVGSCPDRMTEGAKEFLPYISHGEHTYQGGVAIANITHVSHVEEGHYVVFLDRRGDEFVYYDPYDHEIVHITRDELRWQSYYEPIVDEWTINFGPLEGMEFDDWLALRETLTP